MERENFYEKLRGISIIMVVLIHTIDINSNHSLFFRQIFNFAVPVFIFLSGYFVKESIFIQNIRAFINKKLSRIIIPYFIWSIFAILIMQLINGFDFKKIVISLITGGALVPYYFIIVLLQLILATPIMVKLDKYKMGKILLWSITPIALLILYYINLYSSLTFTYYALPFPMWFIFYYYGYKVGNDKNIERKVSNNSLFNAVTYVFFLGLSMI